MIRNILFLIFFYIGIISICIFYLPTFLLPHKITLTGGKLMGHWSKFCLNLFFLLYEATHLLLLHLISQKRIKFLNLKNALNMAYSTKIMVYANLPQK